MTSRIDHTKKNKKRGNTLLKRNYKHLISFLSCKGGFATKQEVFNAGISRHVLTKLLSKFRKVKKLRLYTFGRSDYGIIDILYLKGCEADALKYGDKLRLEKSRQLREKIAAASKKRMKKANPMWNAEAKKRMIETSRKRGYYLQWGQRLIEYCKNHPHFRNQIVQKLREKGAYKQFSYRMKVKNPMFNNATRLKVSETLRNNYGKIFSERLKKAWQEGIMPKLLSEANGHRSKGQKQIYACLDDLGIKYEKEHHIYDMQTKRHFFLDVAIPELKLDIEYDGHTSHYTTTGMLKDAKRDKILSDLGWYILRIKSHENVVEIRRRIFETIKTLGGKVCENRLFLS
jgi:very-short-patch-repair endonuclease